MPTPPDEPRFTARAIGKLCVGADWAAAHGDLSALRYVAQCLAVHAPEPLHCELLGLAEACSYDPDHAVERWMLLKEELFTTGTA